MHGTLDGSGMQVVATCYMKMNLNEMRLFSPHFFSAAGETPVLKGEPANGGCEAPPRSQ